MKHILVTTDFSVLADAALAPAAELAQRLGAELTVIHVVTSEKPPRPIPDAPYYKVAQRLWEADAELEEQTRASLAERSKGLAVPAQAAITRDSSPVEAILAWAGANGVDLIVISSQGRTGVKRLLLGSVAEELARTAQVPVLIWKGKGQG